MNNNENKCINCTVENCIYNNNLKCSKENIEVGSSHNNIDETVCNSYCPNTNKDLEITKEVVDELEM